MPASPALFRRPTAFRFYFHKLRSSYTAHAFHFSDALDEATRFIASCGIADPGEVTLYIDDNPASKPLAA